MSDAQSAAPQGPCERDAAVVLMNASAVSKRTQAQVEERIGRLLPACRVLRSQAPGDIERLAALARDSGAGRVIVVGGDGTIHEAANALAGSATALAVVPAGSGNDFVRSLGIPRAIDAALACAVSGTVSALDAIRVTCVDGAGSPVSRICVNIAEAGMGAEVVALSERTRRFVGRTLGYHAALAIRLFTARPQPVRLWVDGIEVPERPLNNLIVANGRYFGGGMHPMPHAALDDGRLDAARIRDLGPLGLLWHSPLIQIGLPAEHPFIDQWTLQELRAEAEGVVPVEADGELLGQLPAIFAVMPGALRVVCPGTHRRPERTHRS